MSQNDNQQDLPPPYVIESSLPTRYPRGWFCIGADYEFTNKPMQLDYFGTSLVAYRGEEAGEGAHAPGSRSKGQGHKDRRNRGR